MKKILFPTDFSQAATNAFIYALQMAKHLDAEIITLHVYEMPMVNYIDVPAYLTEIYDSVELSRFENYKSSIPELRRIASENQMDAVKVSNVLVSGDLVQTVLQMVKDDQIDCIVMGTKGASGAKETFLGTSAASIMTQTSALVLAVPENCVYTSIRKIVFTTRFSEKDFPALQQLLVLARAFNASVNCVHVQKESSAVNEVVIADWKLLLKEENVQFHMLRAEEIEASILQFIADTNSDIIALFNHKRSFFESLFHTSLTRKLAFHSSIPVLALHEN